MTWGYAHNADHSPTLNLLHSHYTVIIHNLAGGITLINRGEVIKAKAERKRGLSDNTGTHTVLTYNPVAPNTISSRRRAVLCCFMSRAMVRLPTAVIGGTLFLGSH